jgi:ACS family hexuronate transporter-like MFS transporter
VDAVKTPPRTRSRRRILLLGLLVLAGLLNYADRQIIAVLKPLLQTELHWSDLDYGRMTSVFQLASAVAFLGAGWLVDRLGWRRANPLAVGAWSLAAMAHAAARSIGEFTLVRVALGATEALGTPTAIKTVAVFFKADERSLAMGAMNMANNAGAVVTPLVIPGLALAVGWRASFVVLGCLGLLWAAAWVVTARGEVGPGAAAAEALPRERGLVLTVLKDRATWAIAGAKALSDQVWWFLLFWTPDLLHRVFHLSLKQLGAPVATIYFIAAFGSLAAGYVSGRLVASGVEVGAARKRTMLVCALLVTPVPLLLVTHQVWIAVALLSVTLGAHQGFSVNLFTLVTDVAPQSRVASMTSVGSLCGNLAGMAVLQAAGWLLANGYGYAPLLGLAAVSYLLALLWLQLMLPRIRPQA